MYPSRWGIIAPTSIYSYKEQWSAVLCRPSPDLERSVSNERITPRPLQRNANAGCFARSVLAVAGLSARYYHIQGRAAWEVVC